MYSLCVPGQTCDKQHVQRHLACMRTVNSGECVQWGQYQDFLVPSKSDASFGRVGRQPLLAITWQNRQPFCGKLMLSSLHQWNATSTPSSSCFHLYSKARTCLSFLSSRRVCTNPQWQKCFKRIITTFISQISAFTSVKCSCVFCAQMFLFFFFWQNQFRSDFFYKPGTYKSFILIFRSSPRTSPPNILFFGGVGVW